MVTTLLLEGSTECSKEQEYSKHISHTTPLSRLWELSPADTSALGYNQYSHFYLQPSRLKFEKKWDYSKGFSWGTRYCIEGKRMVGRAGWRGLPEQSLPHCQPAPAGRFSLCQSSLGQFSLSTPPHSWWLPALPESGWSGPAQNTLSLGVWTYRDAKLNLLNSC